MIWTPLLFQLRSANSSLVQVKISVEVTLLETLVDEAVQPLFYTHPNSFIHRFQKDSQPFSKQNCFHQSNEKWIVIDLSR